VDEEGGTKQGGQSRRSLTGAAKERGAERGHRSAMTMAAKLQEDGHGDSLVGGAVEPSWAWWQHPWRFEHLATHRRCQLLVDSFLSVSLFTPSTKQETRIILSLEPNKLFGSPHAKN
jgi:hypothetical protein